MFATHYHELTELEGKLNNVNNYCIAVKENGDDVVFLRKIVPGGADKSYGIQVAKLAGVPESVIERAKEISEELSAHDIAELTGNLIAEHHKPRKKKEKLDEVDLTQMSLFDTVKDDDIIKEVRELDLGNLTPIDALNIMGGKQGFGSQKFWIADMLHHSPGNAQPVKGTGSPADFIQHQKAVTGGVTENIGNFCHFHHKRALAAGQIVGSPYSCKYPIHNSDFRLFRRNKAADLGHQNNQSRLTNLPDNPG